MELRKRYRESARSRGFIEQCLLVADSCIAMNRMSANNSTMKCIRYLYATQSDYLDLESDYHFLSESDLIRPHLVLEETVETKDDVTGTTRFIEATMPRHRVRNRLKNYIEYLEDGHWQDETGMVEQNPIIMLICPTLAGMIYCK